MTVDPDHDDVILATDLMGAVDQKTVVDLYKLLGLNTVNDALKWEDVFQGYVMKEYNGFRQLQIDWMAAIHNGNPSYTFSLNDIDNDEARAHFGETREELERVFNLADTNNDGLVDGEEACRLWVGDADILCSKFKPEYKEHWLTMIENWVRNPLAHE